MMICLAKKWKTFPFSFFFRSLKLATSFFSHSQGQIICFLSLRQQLFVLSERERKSKMIIILRLNFEHKREKSTSLSGESREKSCANIRWAQQATRETSSKASERKSDRRIIGLLAIYYLLRWCFALLASSTTHTLTPLVLLLELDPKQHTLSWTFELNQSASEKKSERKNASQSWPILSLSLSCPTCGSECTWNYKMMMMMINELRVQSNRVRCGTSALVRDTNLGVKWGKECAEMGLGAKFHQVIFVIAHW